MSMFPAPTWVSDKYKCADCSAISDRYRRPEDDDTKWKGIVRCKNCGGLNTKMVERGPFTPPVAMAVV